MINFDKVMETYDSNFQKFLKQSRSNDLDFKKYESKVRKKVVSFLKREVKRVNNYVKEIEKLNLKFPNYKLDDWYIIEDVCLEIKYTNWTFFITFEPESSYSFDCMSLNYNIRVDVA